MALHIIIINTITTVAFEIFSFPFFKNPNKKTAGNRTHIISKTADRGVGKKRSPDITFKNTTILYNKKKVKERVEKKSGQINNPATHPIIKGTIECVIGNHPHNIEKVYERITNINTMDIPESLFFFVNIITPYLFDVPEFPTTFLPKEYF